MSGQPRRALMLGTAGTGRGGVASVVTVLEQEGFFRRHQVRYLSTHVEHGALRKLRQIATATLQLTAECLRGGRPIVHAHSASRASFYRKSFLLALARGFGCPTIFHLHGAEFQQFSQKEAGPLMRRWIRHTLERSSAVIALSDTWAQFLRGYAPGAQVTVVRNSVPLPPVQPDQAQGDRVLFLGRADQRKGVFDLLSAFAEAVQQFPDAQLRIGGDGDLEAVRARAAALGIGERVHILGWIGAAQKKQELERAGLFVLPSYDEGLPMAMLEAMAAGKAVVVTPVGGIPEAVRHEFNGLLVAPGAPPALAQALARLMGDAGLRQRLGNQARATIAEHFGTDTMMDKLSALYGRLDGGQPLLPAGEQ